MTLLKNFLLYVLSLILLAVMWCAGMLYGIFRSFYRLRFKTGINNLSRKLLKLATTVDMLGAIVCFELFNDVLITKKSVYKFDPTGITISETLGHNQNYGTLTRTGEWLVSVLNAIERHHCLKAAGYLP